MKHEGNMGGMVKTVKELKQNMWQHKEMENKAEIKQITFGTKLALPVAVFFVLTTKMWVGDLWQSLPLKLLKGLDPSLGVLLL